MTESAASIRQRLTAGLQRGAPSGWPGGWARRSQFAPELAYGRHQMPPPHDARAATVLVLLFPDGDQWRVPLTCRPWTLAAHAGQVSLPGGAVEANESTEQAALRELQEELGVDIPLESLVGRLSDTYVFASNFLVTPFVAVVDDRPPFQPNPDEVANLLEPSVVDLVDPARRQLTTIRRGPIQFAAMTVHYQGHSIWGATSVILEELLECLGE